MSWLSRLQAFEQLGPNRKDQLTELTKAASDSYVSMPIEAYPRCAVPEQEERGSQRALLAHEMPSEWLEGLQRLSTMRRPPIVPPRRWVTVLNTAIGFTDTWTETAAAFGWNTMSLFGVHPRAPVERLDCAGLVWMLNDNSIVALTETRATIRTRTGAKQVYHRQLIPPDTVVALWNLATVAHSEQCRRSEISRMIPER